MDQGNQSGTPVGIHRNFQIEHHYHRIESIKKLIYIKQGWQPYLTVSDLIPLREQTEHTMGITGVRTALSTYALTELDSGRVADGLRLRI